MPCVILPAQSVLCLTAAKPAPSSDDAVMPCIHGVEQGRLGVLGIQSYSVFSIQHSVFSNRAVNVDGEQNATHCNTTQHNTAQHNTTQYDATPAHKPSPPASPELCAVAACHAFGIWSTGCPQAALVCLVDRGSGLPLKISPLLLAPSTSHHLPL